MIIPEKEKIELVLEVFDDLANIFLLTHQNLPGTNLKSTVSQVNSLISDINKRNSTALESKEIYLIGKAAKSALDLSSSSGSIDTMSFKWYKMFPILSDLISRLIHRDVVKWMIINDTYDRELYSRFSDTHRYKNLIGMAMSGIQQLLKEVTEDSIKLIEQEDGYIYIERRELFTTYFFIRSQLTPYLKDNLRQLVNEIQDNHSQDILNFNGEVRRLSNSIDIIVEDYLRMMI